MSKQTIYNAGIYVCLSQEDMRAGESLSIENQKPILTRHVSEQGWKPENIYVDYDYSSTDLGDVIYRYCYKPHNAPKISNPAYSITRLCRIFLLTFDRRK